MAEQQPPPGFKNVLLDEIMETMDTDLDSNSDHCTEFGITTEEITCQPWENYPPHQNTHYINQHMHSEPCNISPLNSVPTSLYMQNVPTYEPSILSNQIYLSPKTVNHIGINENNDLVGTIDVGGGNYVNVIYGNASQIMGDSYHLPRFANYTNESTAGHEYGLFQDQHSVVSSEIPNRKFNGKHLIDNLVGNWVPNQSGTYSPFGSSTDTSSQTKQEAHQVEELPRNVSEVHNKKPRMVAEVKPMRPSYSDILTKSAPVSMSSLPLSSVKPKVEPVSKKNTGKNSKMKVKGTMLKRQNSSGSDDHNSPKMRNQKPVFEKNNVNLPRRWVSLDNLGLQTASPITNTFERSEDVEKKKKTSKKNEKYEVLNNSKFSQNCKGVGNLPKCPIQINNNLNTTNTSSQTVFSEKLDKNQSTLNRTCKDEKKINKERSSKRSQMEKSAQFKKAHKIRKRENKDSSIQDLFKNAKKYISQWNTIVLKVLYWLIHLILDVVSMSTNLVIQLGKCVWYFSILYIKYFWIYIVDHFSKIRILNAFGKYLDTLFGNTKFAFWRKFKTKPETKDEAAHWLHTDLETNIALPSTGEEAMKRLLACKGKDPYSILGVTPTCSDDDIRKYYKRQAVLVHPDKNNQPGAEEAFKILVHAFDIIGEPERRLAFDQTRQVEAACGDLSDLLSQLHRKMEQAANTIRCTNCGLRHKRIPTQRPCYAARFCAQCKICHSAKEGDIWAESRVMGFLWHYYACMEGAVYDVTDWAACQANNLKRLKANTHNVHYRIVLGQRLPPQTSNNGKKRSQVDADASEADFTDFLNNRYNHSKPGNGNTPSEPNIFKGDYRRRKSKRKK